MSPPPFLVMRRLVGGLGGAELAGTTNNVMLCAGSVTPKLVPLRADVGEARDRVGRRELPDLRRAAHAAKLARLTVTGVLADRYLLTTMTVSAPSAERTAAKAETVSGFGDVAATLVSPKVDSVAVVVAVHLHRLVGGRASTPASSSGWPGRALRGRRCRGCRPGSWRR